MLGSVTDLYEMYLFQRFLALRSVTDLYDSEVSGFFRLKRSTKMISAFFWIFFNFENLPLKHNLNPTKYVSLSSENIRKIKNTVTVTAITL